MGAMKQTDGADLEAAEVTLGQTYIGVHETIDTKARMRETLEAIASRYEGELGEEWERRYGVATAELARTVLNEIDEAERDHARRLQEAVERFRNRPPKYPPFQAEVPDRRPASTVHEAECDCCRLRAKYGPVRHY